MAQVTKNSIPILLQNRFYFANGQQKITGVNGRDMFQDIADSIIWYNERIKPIFYPLEIEYQGNNAEPVHTPGKYYRQIWDATSSNPNMNAQYEDIVEWETSSSSWVAAPIFDNTKDWIVYVKGETLPDEGSNWVYDHRKDAGTRWDDILLNKVTPHNFLLYLQGGAPNEYYHITEEIHNLINNVRNKLYGYVPYIVKDKVAFGAAQPATPSTSVYDYYLQEIISGGSEKYELRRINNSGNYEVVDISTAVMPLNTVVYCEADTNNYIIDRSSGSNYFISQGINNVVNHNNTQGLQGGDPANNFFGHLTEEQLNSIGATNSAYYLNVDNVHQVVDTVANINYSNQQNGDYVIVNNESGNSSEEKLYQLVGGTWTLSSYPISKRYEVYNIHDGEVYFYDKNANSGVGAFVAKGRNKLTYHNWQQGLQGGDSVNNFFGHLTEEQSNILNANVQYEISVFIDPVAGDDANSGLSSSSRVQTISRVLEILEGFHVNKITFNISSSSQTVFVIGTVLDEYFVANNVEDLSFIMNGTTVVNSGVTISNGVVGSTTVPSMKASSVDLTEDVYLINNNVFKGGAGIDTNSGTDSAKAFVSPKSLTNGTYDISKFNITVQLDTELVSFNNIYVSGGYLNLSDSDITHLRELGSSKAYIEFNDFYIDVVYIVNTHLKGDLLFIKSYSYFGRISNESFIVNNGVLEMDGLVNYDYIKNNRVINNDSQQSDTIIAFIGVSSLFDASYGSVVRLIDVPHLLLINSNSTSIVKSDNDKFDITISYSPTDALEADNDETYVPGIDAFKLYNSEEANMNVSIGDLIFVSNRNHIRLEGITIDTTPTAAATVDVGHFKTNTGVRLKINIVNPNGKSYYKEVYCILDDSSGYNVYSSVPDGADNSSGISESTADMFNVNGDVLELTLQTATTAINNAIVDIEIERTMR